MNENIIINGDITEVPENIDVIVHQANTSNIMRAGVALTLTNKWPEALEKDKEYYLNTIDSAGGNEEVARHFMLGTYSITEEMDNFKGGRVRVVNLYGQHLNELSLAGSATDYNAVIKAFRALVKDLEAENRNLTIGIPYGMGCGLGGGNWSVYKKIIDCAFVDAPSLRVVIVKYNR